MSVSAITSSSVAAAYTPPQPAQQKTEAPQKAPVKDTVSISAQAQKLASDGDPQAQEVRESGAERSTEAAKGRA